MSQISRKLARFSSCSRWYLFSDSLVQFFSDVLQFHNSNNLLVVLKVQLTLLIPSIFVIFRWHSILFVGKCSRLQILQLGQKHLISLSSLKACVILISRTHSMNVWTVKRSKKLIGVPVWQLLLLTALRSSQVCSSTGLDTIAVDVDLHISHQDIDPVSYSTVVQSLRVYVKYLNLSKYGKNK